MIVISMICNINKEDSLYRENARSEVLHLQHDRVQIKAKSKEGKIVTSWQPKENLKNFRYWATYNGNKVEFQLARKLADIGTTIYNATQQDLHFTGEYNEKELKRLISEYATYAEYYTSKIDNRNG